MLGIKKVYGLEIESYLLDSANKLARVYGVQDNIEWVLGDVHHLPMSDQSLDGVISFEGIEHFRELAVYFSECYRALRPGGIVYARSGANSLNPFVRWHLAQIHRKAMSEPDVFELVNKVPRDRETGSWAERPLNPYAVASQMRSVGFAARVLRTRFFITGCSLKRRLFHVFGKIITLTHPASLVISPSIEVLGVK
jgi:ubiquinone/menaquinone biosynthesis C-methylase UbiE